VLKAKMKPRGISGISAAGVMGKTDYESQNHEERTNKEKRR
jgi:hypothetical protein